jgi:hypothetical protein
LLLMASAESVASVSAPPPAVDSAPLPSPNTLEAQMESADALQQDASAASASATKPKRRRYDEVSALREESHIPAAHADDAADTTTAAAAAGDGDPAAGWQRRLRGNRVDFTRYLEAEQLDVFDNEYSFVEPKWHTQESHQLFHLRVRREALLFLTVHAHLTATEIIGWLAGRWEPTTRRLYVETAYPVKAAATHDDHINAEMDEIDMVVVGETIRNDGKIIVGWYVSARGAPVLPVSHSPHC